MTHIFSRDHPFALVYNARMEVLAHDAFISSAAQCARRLTRTGEAATVLALHGDLGSGKTTFVQALARELGVTDTPISPTFVIQKYYPLTGAAFDRLVHIDAYRLESARQLEVLGWYDLVGDPTQLIAIEWPEHVAEAIPDSAQHIYFTYVDEDTRSIHYGKEN